MPMLWIGVALTLGQFRLRQIEVKQELKWRLDERTLEAVELAHYVESLEAKCLALERQATRRRSAGDLGSLDAVNRLASPDSDLDAGLAEVVRGALPGAALSLYRATSEGLECIMRVGHELGARVVDRIAAAHPLNRALTDERRVVTILRKGDEDVLQDTGLAAAPVLAADGRAVGAIKLDTVDPALLTSALPGALLLISRHVAPHFGEPRMAIDNTSRERAKHEGRDGELGARNLRRRPWSGGAFAIEPPAATGAAAQSQSHERSNAPLRRT